MFTLSPAGPTDLPSVLDLLRACQLLEEGVEAGIAQFVVARVDSNVVGCCGLELYGRDGLLRSLAIDENWRGRGVAAALVMNTVMRAEQRRLTALYLLTTTASVYMERFEFRACARDEAPVGIRGSWEFRAGCPETAILMRRSVVQLSE